MDKTSKSVTNLFIALALLALITLVVSVNQKEGSNKLLAPGLLGEINQTNSLTIKISGEKLVAEIRKLGDKWVVVNAKNYPANLATVRNFLLALSEAEILEKTTTKTENYEKLGVSDITSENASSTLVEIINDNRTLNLLLGNLSSGNSTFARLQNDKQSWRVSGSLNPGIETKDWLNRSIIDIKPYEIKGLEIKHRDGEIVRIDQSDNNFILRDKSKDQLLKTPKILESLVGAFTDLKFDEFNLASNLTTKQKNPLVKINIQMVNGIILDINAIDQDDSIWLIFNANQPPEVIKINENTVIEEELDTNLITEEINRRLKNWAYKVPSYKSDWLIKRNADLLNAST